MTLFAPRLTSSNNWDVLVFDFSQLGAGRSNDEPSLLPNAEVIKELFCPWLGNPPPEYRLKNYINTKEPSANSILICRTYSNWAVNKIFLHYSDPSQSLISLGEPLRNFCEKNSIPYEYVEYYLLVLKYFEIMLPIPVDSKVLSAMTTRVRSILAIGEVPRGTGFGKQDKQIEKSIKQKRILSERFDSYRTAYQQISPIINRFNQSDELKAAIRLITEVGDAVNKRDNKIKNDKRRTKDNEIITSELQCDFSIRQCWFCGKFYELPRSKANNYSRYCDDLNCKKSYNAWRQAFKNKGESLDSIGL